MKRLLVAAVAVAVLVAPQMAGALTLSQRVAKVEAKLACVGKMPVTTYADYAWYPTIPDPGFPNWALWWGYGVTPDAHVLAVKPTSLCRAKFTTLAEPAFVMDGVAAEAATARGMADVAELKQSLLP